jgi:hypothetical protein
VENSSHFNLLPTIQYITASSMPFSVAREICQKGGFG